MFEKGENIGPYQIIEQLGHGGMATVYKAYHANLDRYVALKVLHPALKEAEGFLDRFEREAKLVARLDHPNIIPIYDFDEYKGNPYLVMRFVKGKTLKARMRTGAISMPRTVQIVTSVGVALAYAHGQNVLHRDIKPSNVMLTDDGKVFLTDFGLARMAQIGESTLSRDMMIGTPQYISPEQAKGEKVDHRTDIYSLGVVIYELMVGQVPYTADTPYAIVHDHIFAPLPMPRDLNPQVPEEVERFLLKALAKNRDDRYADVTAMVDAFVAAIEESGVKSLKITPIDQSSATDQKREATVATRQHTTETIPRSVPPARATKATPRKQRQQRPPVLWALVGLALLVALLIAGGLVFSRVITEEFEAVYSEIENEGSFLDRPHDVAWDDLLSFVR